MLPQLSSLLLPLSVLAQLATASLQIIPGASITTTNAPFQHMQAHGGGLILVDGVYYMHGENKLDGSAFQSINCYSTTDLVNWKFVSKTLTVGGSGDLGPGRVVERPHVIYNERTKKYVMWLHIDSSNYGDARVGVATSDTVCGTYNYIGSERPLGFESRDISLYKDTDGTAYLLTEDRKTGLRIDKLSADYVKVESATYLWAELYAFEAAAVVKVDNVYFMFASRQSGWSPNDNVYCTSTNLAGPWSSWELFAPSGSKTYNSQTTAVVNINGVIMYMGDRWVSSNLMRSTYVWLPLSISGRKATLNNQVNWILDMKAGTWSPGPTETQVEGEASSNTIANGAKSVSCSGCSGKKTMGYIGGPSNGKLTMPNVSSTVTTNTTIRIGYTNADQSQRYAKVTVNGVSYTVAFIPTGDDNTPGTAAFTVPLNAGDNNVIVFEAYNGGWGPNIDRIMVPKS